MKSMEQCCRVLTKECRDERGTPTQALHPEQASAIAYCKKLARSHYENFHVASFFLPKSLRQAFYIVYAYCRCADDIADEHDGSSAARQLALGRLDDWQRQLEQCFNQSEHGAGQNDTGQNDEGTHPVFVALRPLIQEYALPKEPFADLLIAFRRDQTHQPISTLSDLLDYSRYSAVPVGRIVLHLICKPTNEQFAWSDSICTALQLANSWQDVKQDKAVGRCYIPQDIAQRYGVDLTDLVDSPEFRRMMQELVADARARFLAGVPLIASVPQAFRPEISLFIRGGLAILDAIERIQYNVLEHRPALSRWTKLRLLLSAAFRQTGVQFVRNGR